MSLCYMEPENQFKVQYHYDGTHYDAEGEQKCSLIHDNAVYLTPLHSERPKLHRVLALLSAIGLNAFPLMLKICLPEKH